MWRRNWAGIVPLFAFPAEIRQAIYTTNNIIACVKRFV
jgi:putative transposase